MCAAAVLSVQATTAVSAGDADTAATMLQRGAELEEQPLHPSPSVAVLATPGIDFVGVSNRVALVQVPASPDAVPEAMLLFGQCCTAAAASTGNGTPAANAAALGSAAGKEEVLPQPAVAEVAASGLVALARMPDPMCDGARSRLTS